MSTQQMEIETIAKRKIELNLSDADCERIYDLAGEAGLTVPALLENFIGDLVEGTYSNGSDERSLAQNWFERCWFGMFPEKTFLNYLIQNGSAERIVSILEDKECMSRYIEASKSDLNNADYKWDEIVNSDNIPCHASRQEWENGEKECIKEYIEELEEGKREISNYWEDYISQTGEKRRELDMEMEKVIRWWEDKQQFIGSTKADGQADAPVGEQVAMGTPEPTEIPQADETAVNENLGILNAGTSQNTACRKHKSR